MKKIAVLFISLSLLCTSACTAQIKFTDESDSSSISLSSSTNNNLTGKEKIYSDLIDKAKEIVIYENLPSNKSVKLDGKDAVELLELLKSGEYVSHHDEIIDKSLFTEYKINDKNGVFLFKLMIHYANDSFFLDNEEYRLDIEKVNQFCTTVKKRFFESIDDDVENAEKVNLILADGASVSLNKDDNDDFLYIIKNSDPNLDFDEEDEELRAGGKSVFDLMKGDKTLCSVYYDYKTGGTVTVDGIEYNLSDKQKAMVKKFAEKYGDK